MSAYSVEQLKQALYRADQQGDKEAAQMIADRIKQAQAQTPEPQPQAEEKRTGGVLENLASAGANMFGLRDLQRLGNTISGAAGGPELFDTRDDNAAGRFAEGSRVALGRSIDKTVSGARQIGNRLQGDQEELESLEQRARSNDQTWRDNASGGLRAGEFLYDMAQFAVPGGAVAKGGRAINAGLRTMAPAQAAVAAGTDMIHQLGEQGDISAARTALAGAGGAAGEFLGPLFGRAINALRKSGQTGDDVVEVGARMVREMGEDPTQYSREALRNVAEQGEKASSMVSDAATRARAEFGIDYTRGQSMRTDSAAARATRRNQLLRESDARGLSQKSGDILSEFDAQQKQQVADAIQGMQTEFSGRANPITRTNEAGEIVAEQLREAYGEAGNAVREAYNNVRRTGGQFDASAFDNVAERLRNAAEVDADGIRSVVVDDLTPNAQRMLARLGKFGEEIAESGKGVDFAKAESLRRQIGGLVDNAEKGDRVALLRMKREYDRVLDDAIDNSLFSGNADDALDQLKEARALRADMARRFESAGAGDDAGRFIEKILDEERSPSEVIDYFIGAGQFSRKGGSRLASRVIDALGADSEAVKALKEATLMRIAEARGNGTLAKNLQDAVQGRGEYFLRELFSQEELAKLSRFKEAIELLEPPKQGPNWSNSGYTILRNMGDMMSMVMAGDPFALAAMQGAKQSKGFLQTMRTRRMITPLLARQSSAIPAAAGAVAGGDLYSQDSQESPRERQ